MEKDYCCGYRKTIFVGENRLLVIMALTRIGQVLRNSRNMKIRIVLAVIAVCPVYIAEAAGTGQDVMAEKCVQQEDTSDTGMTDTLAQVVVTGTRSRTDIRHLPLTVTVLDRPAIEYSYTPSLLPVLTEQVPGFFSTSRGVMGYGVSGGAAGNISVRGLSGGSGQVMVLIDGHPQYMGMFGHPISDAYQSLMAEQVEVLRGPASVLYGSNAMGGVVNIVTRRMEEDGVRTNISAGYGSWNTSACRTTARTGIGRIWASSSTAAMPSWAMTLPRTGG